MVERIGICEKHQLPLDRNGECELCRLSEMPSEAPPSGTAWWTVIIPVVLAVVGIAWALSSWGSEPRSVPQRGVRTTAPRPVSPPPSREEPRAPELEAIPEPPVPGDDIPVPEPPMPGDDIPAPEPNPESGQP